MPWELVADRGQHLSDEARRDGVDVAIGTDEPNRDRTHPRDDAIAARIKTGRVWLTLGARIGSVSSAGHWFLLI